MNAKKNKTSIIGKPSIIANQSILISPVKALIAIPSIILKGSINAGLSVFGVNKLQMSNTFMKLN